MDQAKKFYGFCKGASIVNDIKFALKTVNICKKLLSKFFNIFFIF